MLTEDQQTKRGTTIGVISDTHGLLRPEAIAALESSDLILHAGDIGKPEILEQLEAIAPVVAVRGNNDTGDWAKAVPDRQTIQVEGITIHILHIATELQPADFSSAQVVVSGHSHKPAIVQNAGKLFLNPGSAGPRRFKLPIALARLQVSGNTVQAEIVELVS